MHIFGIFQSKMENGRTFSMEGCLSNRLRIRRSTDTLNHLFSIYKNYLIVHYNGFGDWKTIEEFSDFIVDIELED